MRERLDILAGKNNETMTSATVIIYPSSAQYWVYLGKGVTLHIL